MTTEAHLWNAGRSPERGPRPAKHLWALSKQVRRIDCELRTFEGGAEVQLLVDGGFYSGWWYASVQLALRAADDLHARLTLAGWTSS
jgi:hypothetical protein